MAVDAAGTAYITTHNSPGATKVTSSGAVSDWTGFQSDLWWGRDGALSPTGDFYTIQGLMSGPDPRSSVAKIDTATGVVQYPLTNLPWLNGIAFDSAGHLYLSEYLAGKVVMVDLGTMSIQPIADIQYASSLSFDQDGNLYVYSTPAHLGAPGSNKIFVIPSDSGNPTLFADNLPYLTDIAFLSTAAPVPEPSSGIIFAGLVTFALSRRRIFTH